MRLVAGTIIALWATLAAAQPAPAPMPGAAAPATYEAGDWWRFLPPPPPRGSLEQQAELRTMLDVQTRRSAADVAQARTDQKIGAARFDEAVGIALDGTLPRTLALLDRVRAAASPVQRAAKLRWKQPRPYDFSPTIRPVLDRPGTREEPSYAYPSGHSLWGYATALTLAAMVPERRETILARGRLFGWSRVVGGVHWPSDVEAGRLLASTLVVRLTRDPGFRGELATATRELRVALKLPPRAPDLPR